MTNQLGDFAAFTELYFITPDDSDTLYNGSIMKIFDEYDVVCKITTTRDIHSIPYYLTGYLEPEGEPVPTQIMFERWPQGDYSFPCDDDYPLRTYAYRFSAGFIPVALFPAIPPEEWADITRYLECALYGNQNQMNNDARVRGTLMSGLQLDRQNDSTLCFIPANEEEMPFVFRYSPYIGLNPESDVRFRVWNVSNELIWKSR